MNIVTINTYLDEILSIQNVNNRSNINVNMNSSKSNTPFQYKQTIELVEICISMGINRFMKNSYIYIQ